MQSLKIIYEDNHLLVVNKEAGVVTQGALPHQVSLVDLARDYIREKYQKPGNVYLGVVSRLDSMVTGVIVLAKTSKAASRLNSQFRSSTIEKKYLAIVKNNLSEPQGVFTDWLLKNDAKHKIESVDQNTTDAKRAELSYHIIKQVNNLALVEIQLLTGRKHQIRVQFGSRDCSIVGDQKYDSALKFPAGIALHSYFLALDHPTRAERLEFCCDPPDYWPIKRSD